MLKYVESGAINTLQKYHDLLHYPSIRKGKYTMVFVQWCESKLAT